MIARTAQCALTRLVLWLVLTCDQLVASLKPLVRLHSPHTLESMDKKLRMLINLVPSVRVCLRFACSGARRHHNQGCSITVSSQSRVVAAAEVEPTQQAMNWITIHDIECSAEALSCTCTACELHCTVRMRMLSACGQQPLVTWSHRCHRVLPVHVHVLGRQAGAL